MKDEFDPTAAVVELVTAANSDIPIAPIIGNLTPLQSVEVLSEMTGWILGLFDVISNMTPPERKKTTGEFLAFFALAHAQGQA